jgi:hypothetical protein
MLALQPSKALRPSRFSKWSSWDANAEQMIFQHRLNSVPRENATQQNDRPPREFTNALPKSAACCLAAKSAKTPEILIRPELRERCGELGGRLRKHS